MTSCSTIIRKTKVEEIENTEITESKKNQEEPKGIVVDGELRYYDGELVDIAKHEGETIERDGSKYTNNGYIISPEDTFISYAYNNLNSFIYYANDETLEIINNNFEEIDGKLYVKNIEELRKEYTREYKYATLAGYCGDGPIQVKVRPMVNHLG